MRGGNRIVAKEVEVGMCSEDGGGTTSPGIQAATRH